MSRSTYWSNGVPSGFELMKYERSKKPDVFDNFCEGYLWETLQKEDPEQAMTIKDAESCFILRGEVDDQPDLNYFRDAIGILTYLADSGGVSIFDPHMFKWWRIDEWKPKAFMDHEAYPRHHVVILFSDEPDGQWFHTRGMRKFGRSDLSMYKVMPEIRNGVIEMFNRFIEFQAFGGIIEEGNEIRMEGLPAGLFCHHTGDLEDPDFNNVHVEIKKAEQSLAPDGNSAALRSRW
ncbi:MAG: hypothetical protein PVH87_12350 [Desulfobacteraceae bacterium]